MIYIPKENIERVENEDGSDFIFWYYKEDVAVVFEWSRTPKSQNDEIIYVKDNDPFYLNVITIGRENVQHCSEAACQAFPQLRYNSILNKWFCTCPSSMLCTGNTDLDEVKSVDIMKLRRNRQIDEEHGFFDDPIKAILFWNINSLKSSLEINELILNEYIKNGKFNYTI